MPHATTKRGRTVNNARPMERITKSFLLVSKWSLDLRMIRGRHSTPMPYELSLGTTGRGFFQIQDPEPFIACPLSRGRPTRLKKKRSFWSVLVFDRRAERREQAPDERARHAKLVSRCRRSPSTFAIGGALPGNQSGRERTRKQETRWPGKPAWKGYRYGREGCFLNKTGHLCVLHHGVRVSEPFWAACAPLRGELL